MVTCLHWRTYSATYKYSYTALYRTVMYNHSVCSQYLQLPLLPVCPSFTALIPYPSLSLFLSLSLSVLALSACA